MDNYKVSIIIPVFKVEQYIASTVESLLSQTYGNLELIFVNDGTPDRSIDVLRQAIEKYGQHNKEVVILDYGNNRGVGFARNFGTEHANGDFIVYVDSDDFLPHDAIENLINGYELYGADITIGNWRMFYINGDVKQSLKTNIFSEKLYNNVISSARKFQCMPWNKLIKKDFIEKNHLKFEDSIFWEDTYWFYKIMLLNPSVAQIEYFCYDYFVRANSESTMMNYTAKHLLSAIALAVWSKNDYIEFDRDDPRYSFQLKRIADFRNIALMQCIEHCGFSAYRKLHKYFSQQNNSKVCILKLSLPFKSKIRFCLSRLPEVLSLIPEYLIAKIVLKKQRKKLSKSKILSLPPVFFSDLNTSLGNLRSQFR